MGAMTSNAARLGEAAFVQYTRKRLRAKVRPCIPGYSISGFTLGSCLQPTSTASPAEARFGSRLKPVQAVAEPLRAANAA